MQRIWLCKVLVADGKLLFLHFVAMLDCKGANLCWALGRIICNFTPILSYFQHWGGWTLTTIFFRWANQVKTKKRCSPKIEHFFPRIQVKTKKKVFTKNGALFPPSSSENLRSDAHQSQIIGGDADEGHTQIVGGITVKLLGGYVTPIPPRVSAPLLDCFKCGRKFLKFLDGAK